MSETEMLNQPDAQDIESVWFISGAQPMSKGVVELHSGAAGDMLVRRLADVQQNWNTINQQIILILESSEAPITKTGFALDEVSVEIGVNAKGQLAFVAEAGVSATFKLIFRRK